MELYRITLSKFAEELYAAGYPGRWNSKGVPVIYCSWSRSLACLENLVHRSNMVLSNIFSVMLIEIDNSIGFSTLQSTELDNDWFLTNPESYRACQKIGDSWVKDNETCVLKVPSAVIQQEHNFIINPNHEDFQSVRLISVEDFSFDNRMFHK